MRVPVEPPLVLLVVTKIPPTVTVALIVKLAVLDELLTLWLATAPRVRTSRVASS
jgi:hypothetical protein